MSLKNKKIHFIGIGGFGMSSLAEYALVQGSIVSGSDITESNITERLKSLGARIFLGHDASNLPQDTDIVVYTAAVNDDNPEFIEAKSKGIEMIKRAEMLGRLVNDKYLIAVSGTHGKTTTTAMIGNTLADAGLDPVVFVGGNVASFDDATFRMGNSNYAVVEADEYDRSFLTLKPDITVITNIDEDHLDIYDDLFDIKDTFVKFIEGSKEDSLVIYCGDDANASDVASRISRKTKSYGFDSKNDYSISDYSFSDKLNFSINNTKKNYTDISLTLPGRHNVLNAVAGFVVSKELKIDFRKFRKSISNFKTVDRRLQLKYDDHDITVYDDYAHHPQEISSSLNALKEFNRGNWLIVVFQPHLYTRTRDFYMEFAEKLAIADDIVLMDIYPAREKPLPGITSTLIYNEIRKKRNHCLYLNSRLQVINYLLSNVKKDDTVVFQGAGDVTIACDMFIEKLKENLG